MADAQSRSLQYPTGQWEDFARKLLTLFDRPVAEASVSAAAQAGPTRRVTIQVRDRIRKAWAGRWRVHVYVTAAPDADPGGTQTVALVSGSALETFVPNVRWMFLTDTDGKVVLDLTLAGVGMRFVYADVVGKPAGSDALSWS